MKKYFIAFALFGCTTLGTLVAQEITVGGTGTLNIMGSLSAQINALKAEIEELKELAEDAKITADEAKDEAETAIEKTVIIKQESESANNNTMARIQNIEQCNIQKKVVKNTTGACQDIASTTNNNNTTNNNTGGNTTTSGKACFSQKIGNCQLSSRNHGEGSGSCSFPTKTLGTCSASPKISGSCLYTCDDGRWVKKKDTCSAQYDRFNNKLCTGGGR